VTEAARPSIAVSVVSHGQGRLVADLLRDLVLCPEVGEVIVTQNIPEPEINFPEALRSRVHVIRNAQPMGFGANHNQAFRHASSPLFAVLNPDVRLPEDPFPALTAALERPGAGLAAPVVLSPEGTMEDSARYFPTPGQLLSRLLGGGEGRFPVQGQAPLAVDWVAGMFMLLPTAVFREVAGFDEGFFLYCEDVDLCVRLWKSGHRVLLHPGVSVVHAAQRASRRRPRYLAWHVSSLARYFYKHLGRLPRIRPE